MPRAFHDVDAVLAPGCTGCDRVSLRERARGTRPALYGYGSTEMITLEWQVVWLLG